MARRFKQAEIDEIMLNIPTLPKSFNKWMESTPFKDMNYIFYKTKGKVKTGLCSKCGKTIQIKYKKKHNNSGSCPECKAKVTYKAINKATRYEDKQVVSIMQKMGDGYIVRYFKVSRVFKNNEDTSNFPEEILETLTDPQISNYEGSRVYISFSKHGNTEFRDFELEYSWKIESKHWVNERKRSSFNNRELLRSFSPFLYKKNLKSLLKKTKWKYSGLDYMKQKHIDACDYIITYERYPAIEMLSKLGYTNLLNEIIYKSCYWGGVGGILKMHEKRLGLSKVALQTVLRLNLKTQGTEFVTTLEERGRNLSDKQILWAIKNTNTETFTQLLKWISPQKIINYVEKNHDPVVKRGFEHSSSDKQFFTTSWKDYLDQCEYLGLNLEESIVMHPKDLFKKHDENTKIIQKMKNEKVIKRFNTKYNYWHKYLNFNKGKLSIKVAESIGALKEEGKAHGHCVGGYGPRIANENIIVLFIRKADNKPFYTLELNLNTLKIVQVQGKGRIEPTKQVEAFIKEWQGYINRKRNDRSLKSA